MDNQIPGWQKFEEDCVIFLTERYGDKCNFSLQGSSDSSQSDIKVETSTNKSFFIEVKESIAQCGQFVLHENHNTKSFEYSPANKDKLNEYSKQIVDYMNSNFEYFSNEIPTNKNICLDPDIFYNWIQNHYRSKNVSFFITKNDQGKYIIFPIEKLKEYFRVSASFRMKRSGSRTLSSNNIRDVQNALSNIGVSHSILYENNEIIINSQTDIDGKKIKGSKYSYLLKRKNENQYRVRILSNTQNKNVIFSIDLQKDQDFNDLILFEEKIS